MYSYNRVESCGINNVDQGNVGTCSEAVNFRTERLMFVRDELSLDRTRFGPLAE